MAAAVVQKTAVAVADAAAAGVVAVVVVVVVVDAADHFAMAGKTCAAGFEAGLQGAIASCRGLQATAVAPFSLAAVLQTMTVQHLMLSPRRRPQQLGLRSQTEAPAAVAAVVAAAAAAAVAAGIGAVAVDVGM